MDRASQRQYLVAGFGLDCILNGETDKTEANRNNGKKAKSKKIYLMHATLTLVESPKIELSCKLRFLCISAVLTRG
jgi:hypothetical protein